VLTDKAFITAAARVVDSELWADLPEWWRRHCFEKMLNTPQTPRQETDAIASILREYHSGLALLRVLENVVTQNRGNIDGRTARHKRSE
jgi:3-phenylpropionate/cinnamic acid dioxygenase small subunit